MNRSITQPFSQSINQPTNILALLPPPPSLFAKQVNKSIH